MGTMTRDLGILVLLIVLGGAWTVSGAITGRRKRQQSRAMAKAQAAQAELARPLPGLTEYAAAHGWSAPGTDPRLDEFTGHYIHSMIRHLWQVGDYDVHTEGPTPVVHDNRYADVVTGGTAPRTWTVANAWVPVGAGEAAAVGTRNLTAGVCVLKLGAALPPLFVSPRDDRPFMQAFLKEVTLESEDFDRRYRVQALDRKYAMDVMSPRAMELVIARNEWSFSLEGDRVVCVSKGALRSVEDVQAILDAVSRFADLIPSFVVEDRSLHLPTLPDGTPVDPTDPAARERFEQALEAMTPEQQQEAMAKAQVEGARFLAGMFGKDLSPEQVAEATRRIAERHRPEQ